MRRWAVFAIGLTISIALTVLLWSQGIWGGALFLLFPFFTLGRRPRHRCPQCGTLWPRSHTYCPDDGARLQVEEEP